MPLVLCGVFGIDVLLVWCDPCDVLGVVLPVCCYVHVLDMLVCLLWVCGRCGVLGWLFRCGLMGLSVVCYWYTRGLI